MIVVMQLTDMPWQHVWCWWSAQWEKEVDTLLRKCYFNYLLCRSQWIRPGSTWGKQSSKFQETGKPVLCLTFTLLEPNDGKLSLVRLSSQLAVVHEDKYNLILEQGRSLQTEASQVASQQLFPWLFGRQRCQSRSQIPVMEIQPGQQSSS